MKRSEMIEVLNNYNNTLTIEQPDPDWEYVLTLLEEAGMTAPAIKEPCETFVLYNGKYVKTEDSFVYINKWDEE